MFYNNLEKNNVTPPDGETSLTIPTDPHTNLDYDLDTAVLDRLLAANREGEVHIPTSPHHLFIGKFRLLFLWYGATGSAA